MNYKLTTFLLFFILLSSIIVVTTYHKQTKFQPLAFMPIMCGNNDGTMWMLRDGSLSREVGITGSNALDVYSGNWRSS